MSTQPNQPHVEMNDKGRSYLAVIIVSSLTLVLTLILLFLGTWQVQRLSEKVRLIEQIEERAYSNPVAMPMIDEWPELGESDDWNYRNVSVTGEFQHNNEVQVYTVSDIGPGYWILTPLTLADGSSVIINRGFVPQDKRLPNTRPETHTDGLETITGLMRQSEGDSLFLRDNNIADGRWYKRDIVEIGNVKGIDKLAPFYIDADARSGKNSLPIGGKTQLNFPNNHLSYAITWYVLAAMMLVAGFYVVRNLNSPTKHEDDD